MWRYFRNHEEPQIGFPEPKSTFLDSGARATILGILHNIYQCWGIYLSLQVILVFIGYAVVWSWTWFIAILWQKYSSRILHKIVLWVVFKAWYYVPFQCPAIICGVWSHLVLGKKCRQSSSSRKDIAKFCPIWDYMQKKLWNNCLTKRKEYKQKQDCQSIVWKFIILSPPNQSMI